MKNRLWYNPRDKTVSLDKNNWIKFNSQQSIKEDEFFFFSLASDNYLVQQWKNYMPIVFKEKDEVVYQGDFLTICDVPYIYCEEWKLMEEKYSERVKDRFKELRKIKGEEDDKYK